MSSISFRSKPAAHAGLQTVPVAVIFTATIFLSATLLFSVQPMFTKLILPLLGGAPNVWNTAMVFFQALLLAGYVYAHLISKYLALKHQIGLHLMITAIGLAFLPLAVGVVSVPETGMPVFWLLGLFFATVGLPFFALSANAPLLQRWFSLTDHPDAQDPYFLYSASNVGSLLILCAYPVLIEPFISLSEQTALWMGGYLLLILTIGLTGWSGFARRTSERLTFNKSADHSPSRPLNVKTILLWIAFAFVPSSLMLGVTSFMTNNIASAPFLWIMPLALYLLTFVFAFAKKPFLTSSRLGSFIPWIVLLNVGLVFFPAFQSFAVIGLCLLFFFIIAYYCHARLVETRPEASKLTTFYIVMSLGGVLGGIFNALIAPVIFTDTYEYMLILMLAAFVLPSDVKLLTFTRVGLKRFLTSLSFAIIVGFIFAYVSDIERTGLLIATLLSYVAFTHLQVWKPFALSVLVGLLCMPFIAGQADDLIFKDRSFFSTIKVKRTVTAQGLMHSFLHGDTIHNFQLRAPGLRTKPTSYYARGGSFDVMLKAVRGEGDALSVSLVGMGAGAMSCYEVQGDLWTYFEIDPKIVDMALNSDLFSYLADCAPEAKILIGDARQKLADVPEGSQDLIIIDAFSSNAIPAHLLTREAVAFYQSRLKDDGVMFFHTSNRSLDVSSVVARVAEDAGLAARYIAQDFEGANVEYAHLAEGLLIGPQERIDAITQDRNVWFEWVPSRHVLVWTDDYSSIMATIRARSLRDGHAKPMGD